MSIHQAGVVYGAHIRHLWESSSERVEQKIEHRRMPHSIREQGVLMFSVTTNDDLVVSGVVVIHGVAQPVGQVSLWIQRPGISTV